MNVFAQLGRKRTILISISILLVSLHTIYFYHVGKPSIDMAKLGQQTIRFALTIALLYFVYQGKNWAKVIAIILFSLGLFGAISAIFIATGGSIVNKIPLFVMIFVYGMAIYHFGFSPFFKAFYEYQNQRQT